MFGKAKGCGKSVRLWDHSTIERYVNYYNKQRPCYAIGYDNPNHYYQRFQRGELEQKDTFSKRVLTTEPKFIIPKFVLCMPNQ